MSLPVEIADVEAAARRLAGISHHTPVLTSRSLDDQIGATVFAKAECFQRTGSFKFRGAFNAIACLDESERARGVATYSSGNHAQAVALAATLHEVPAVILMPEDAPAAKVAATRGYGAEIVTYDRYRQERTDLGASLADERGMTLIPPFNHPDVMAGQGTGALELFDDAGDLDIVVVCVGGGGLISGWSTVAEARGGTRVIGVEPAAGDDVKQSLEAGELVTIQTPVTIADGQQTTSAGDLTFAVIRERVDEIVVVSDEEIVSAMRFAFERMNVVLEPSGASALAALLAADRIDLQGTRVGVTLSGGNIGVERFVELVGNQRSG